MGWPMKIGLGKADYVGVDGVIWSESREFVNIMLEFTVDVMEYVSEWSVIERRVSEWWNLW